jgi:hypothetical protein
MLSLVDIFAELLSTSSNNGMHFSRTARQPVASFLRPMR